MHDTAWVTDMWVQAQAHKPSESMPVFQQTLLDQTGQESLVKYLRKKQMPQENKAQSKTKLTTCAGTY